MRDTPTGRRNLPSSRSRPGNFIDVTHNISG
jgi:hypothetical protein